MKKQELDFMRFIEDKYSNFLVSDESKEPVEVISTGSIALDVSTGIGGIPRGKFSVIWGLESTGKTTLSLSIAKQAYKRELKTLYIDSENGLDYKYVEALVGTIDQEHLVILHPETAEETLDIAEFGVKSGEFGLIIVDSIGSFAPKKVKEDDAFKAQVAIVPRLLSNFMSRNAYPISSNNVAFVFVNQVRDKIGSYYAAFETPGGHAWKHLTSIRIQLSKIGDIQSEDEKIGILTKFVIKKNKLANPYKTFSFPIIFGKGVDSLRDLVEFSTVIGILDKGGSYYKFEGETLSNGLTNTVKYLEEHKDTLDKIVDKCYNNMNLGRSNLYERENDE